VSAAAGPTGPRVLVAPDAFKGTLAAAEVAVAVASGVVEAGAGADVCPLADGGEGTAEVLGAAHGAQRSVVTVTGPLGEVVAAAFYRTGDGTVFADMASASGLNLVPETRRDAVRADTTGTGELLAAAVADGARRIVLGAGGSATTDGGLGAVEALTAAGGLRGVTLTVLCDVTTTYLDAAPVFAPQKGADAAEVEQLRRRLDERAGTLPRDPRGVPMTGAAGGLAGGLWAAFDARLVAGADAVLDAVGWDARVAVADAVVTGEGRFDAQSLLGKVTGTVLARSAARPVHLVVGSSDLSAADARRLGFASLTLAGDRTRLRAAGLDLALTLLRDHRSR
jgi:glycerate 2-kinase